MKLLNKDPGTCYMCGSTAKEWVTFTSRHAQSKVHLCQEHYEGLRATMMGYLTIQVQDAATPEQRDPA